MPTGKDIVKSLVKFVHAYYNLALQDFDDEVDIDFITTDQAISNIKAAGIIPSVIEEFLDCFEEARISSQFMADPFVTVDRIEIIDFNNTEFLKRNRPFSISDPQFGYVSAKKIFQYSPLSNLSSDAEGHRALIDFVGGALLLPANQLLNDLIQVLEVRDLKKGLLVHKFPHTYPSISIYSYLYYQKLIQGGRIELDPDLNYTGVHSASTVFNGGMLYQQYFEVFDIMNELNHAEDIITRYLKIYHILEYLVYRVELVKVEAKARTNRTFIREINAIAGKGSSEKELELLKKSLSVIFDPEIRAGYFDLGALTQDQQDFFKNYFNINGYNPTEPAHVCQLIYRLRNSIVHNKESEFHMTMTNTDDYIAILPKIVLLLQKLERIVYDKISMDHPTISYGGHQYIELY